MHAWAEAEITAQVTARGEKSIRTMWIFETDAVRRALLERRSFTRDEYVLNHMARALSGPIAAAPPPDGFEVRPAKSRPRRGRGPRTARYRRFARSPAYERERDLAAVAPDGPSGGRTTSTARACSSRSARTRTSSAGAWARPWWWKGCAVNRLLLYEKSLV